MIKMSEERTDAINNFMPEAEKKANKKVLALFSKNFKGLPIKRKKGDPYVIRNDYEGEYEHYLWTEYFCEEMNRLTINAGLRVDFSEVKPIKTELPKQNIKKRNCLRCTKAFISKGDFNRLCDKCAAINNKKQAATEAFVTPHGNKDEKMF